MMIIAALLLSFVFIVFLPAAGFVLFAGVLAAFAVNAGRRAGVALAHLFAPQWRPGEAWLTRGGKAEKTDSLEEVRKEVEERRPGEEPPVKPA